MTANEERQRLDAEAAKLAREALDARTSRERQLECVDRLRDIDAAREELRT